MKLKLNEVLIEPCESIILKNREFGSDTSKMAVEEVQGPACIPSQVTIICQPSTD